MILFGPEHGDRSEWRCDCFNTIPAIATIPHLFSPDNAMLTLSLLLPILFVFAFVVKLLWSVATMDKPRIKGSISHWQQTVVGLQGTTSDFYQLVKAAIRAHDFPDVEVRTIELREAGPFSATRDYLRIEREDLSFDLCVAPFGKGLFVSSWLCQKPTFLLQVLAYFPGIHWLANGWEKLFSSPTYYRVDSAAMFLDGVHGCVLEIIDQLTRDQGVAPIPPEVRKPKMAELYRPKRQLAAV